MNIPGDITGAVKTSIRQTILNINGIKTILNINGMEEDWGGLK